MCLLLPPQRISKEGNREACPGTSGGPRTPQSTRADVPDPQPDLGHPPGGSATQQRPLYLRDGGCSHFVREDFSKDRGRGDLPSLRYLQGRLSTPSRPTRGTLLGHFPPRAGLSSMGTWGYSGLRKNPGSSARFRPLALTLRVRGRGHCPGGPGTPKRTRDHPPHPKPELRHPSGPLYTQHRPLHLRDGGCSHFVREDFSKDRGRGDLPRLSKPPGPTLHTL